MGDNFNHFLLTPSEKRFSLKGKNLLSGKFFPFKVDPLHDGWQNNFLQLPSLEAYPILLTFTNLADGILKYFSYFSQETGCDISCKLSPLETTCMKCQLLFSVENKKNISVCRLLKILPRVRSIKLSFMFKVHLPDFAFCI